MESILDEIKELDIEILRHIVNCSGDKIGALPPTQMRIITYIFSKKSDVYQRDLEKDLNLRRATLSGVLNTMERNNLLYREVSDKDSRSKKIILNDRTKIIFKKKREKLLEVENILIEGIDKNDLLVFMDTLDKMKNNIRKK